MQQRDTLVPAAHENTKRAVSYLNYDINEGCLLIAIRADHGFKLQMRIMKDRFFGKKEEKVIYDQPVAPGKHTFEFPENVLSGFGKNFLSVLINGKVYYIQQL